MISVADQQILCLSGKTENQKAGFEYRLLALLGYKKQSTLTVREIEEGGRMLEKTFEGLANYHMRSLETVSLAL